MDFGGARAARPAAGAPGRAHRWRRRSSAAAFAPPLVRIGLTDAGRRWPWCRRWRCRPTSAGAGDADRGCARLLIGLALALSLRVAGRRRRARRPPDRLPDRLLLRVAGRSAERRAQQRARRALRQPGAAGVPGVNGHHELLRGAGGVVRARCRSALGGGGDGDLRALVARTLGLVFVLGVRLAAPVVLVLLSSSWRSAWCRARRRR